MKDASLPEAGSAVTAQVLAAAVKQLDDEPGAVRRGRPTAMRSR